MHSTLENTEKIKTKIIEHRRHLHRKPELSFKEFETCKYICEVLAKLNIPYEVVCNTGVVAKIGNVTNVTNVTNVSNSNISNSNVTSNANIVSNAENVNCIAFRADIDALPITENTSLSYSSENKGVMHACGHDMHVAMLLGAAEILKANEKNLNGIVKLIFQPAEESLPGGAKAMIANGVLENPKPQMIFAQHINPAENAGTFSVSKTATMAATCEIYWTIKGKGTHAAQPHLGSDTILVATNIISLVQSLMTKYRNPLEQAILSVCSINGGNANNIFPDEVRMSGTLRTFDENSRDYYLELLADKCQQLAKVYDTDCIVDVVKGYPAVINNEGVVEIFQNVVEGLFGSENFSICEPKMIAEDFAYFALEVPACFYFIGAKDTDFGEYFPLHSPKFNPSESVLTKGSALIVELAMNILK